MCELYTEVCDKKAPQRTSCGFALPRTHTEDAHKHKEMKVIGK